MRPRSLASTLCLVVVLLSCSARREGWETQGVQGLRDEMRRLLAYEDDGEFMREFASSLEQAAGFKIIMKHGSSVSTAGCVISLPATPTGAFQISGPEDHIVSVPSWPFVLFVTKGAITTAPPDTADLSDTTMLLGMQNGRIVVVRLGKGTLSLIDPR